MPIPKPNTDFKFLVEEAAKKQKEVELLLDQHYALFFQRVETVRINQDMSKEEFRSLFGFVSSDEVLPEIGIRHIIGICHYFETSPSYLLGFIG